jgi:hypothetical protein
VEKLKRMGASLENSSASAKSASDATRLHALADVLKRLPA